MSEPFTLLMPVYRGDDPAHFAKAFSSSVTAQTRRPDQVVLVQDGPVGDELSAAIEAAVSSSPVPVVHHRIERNVGLARALTEGLARSDHDIVARMDADDISLPERFAKQVPFIERGLDLVGTGMLEFLDDVGSIVGVACPAWIRSRSRATPGSTTRSAIRPWCTDEAPSSAPAATSRSA